MAPFTGRNPTGTVALTALLPVSMTETEFDPALVTYARKRTPVDLFFCFSSVAHTETAKPGSRDLPRLLISIKSVWLV